MLRSTQIGYGHAPAAANGLSVQRFIWVSGVSVAMDFIERFIREDDGQDVVEYGLLIATIAIVVLVGISFFGTQIEGWFKTLAGRITTTGIS